MRVWAALVAGFLLVGCASSNAADRQQLQVVGSFYPLAWAAERVGGRDAAVIDLTPPGVEAHDTNLTAREVAEVEGADVLLLLGYLGFQPQVEAAARHAGGEVVQVVRGMKLRPSQEQGLSADPHVWLDPVLMERIVRTVSAALIRADPGDRVALVNRTRSTMKALTELDRSYRAGLTVCRYRTFVTTHEAFGYVADRYGLHQIGIE